MPNERPCAPPRRAPARAPRRARALALAASLAAGCSAPAPARPPPPFAPRAPAPPPGPGAALERDTLVTSGRFTYGVHLAPLPNLIYQLDCVSGAFICARATFREFWATLGLDGGDEAALAKWKTLRTRHDGELRRADAAALPPPLVSGGSFNLGERQRIASLLARTPAAHEASTALLSSNEDARELTALIARFEPRFTAWWRARGFASGSDSFDGVVRLLGDPFLSATIEKAARFYEAELPPGPALDVHLVVQPASRRRLTTAFQLEGYAVVEMPEGGKPEAFIDVVAHEAFHYFFGRTPAARRAALFERAVSSEDPYAMVALSVADEATASAIGNGFVGRHYADPAAFERRLARDDGLHQYREASVVARALLPSIEGFLEASTVSSEGFVRALLAAARSTYGGGGPRPLDHLRAPALVSGPRFDAARNRLIDASHAGFPYLREYRSLDFESKAFLAEHPLVSAALLLPGEGGQAAAALDALSAPNKHRAALTALAKRARGFVYALPRTPKSYAFLFVAPDERAMGELVERFVALSAVSEGALVELAK